MIPLSPFLSMLAGVLVTVLVRYILDCRHKDAALPQEEETEPDLPSQFLQHRITVPCVMLKPCADGSGRYFGVAQVPTDMIGTKLEGMTVVHMRSLGVFPPHDLPNNAVMREGAFIIPEETDS